MTDEAEAGAEDREDPRQRLNTRNPDDFKATERLVEIVTVVAVR